MKDLDKAEKYLSELANLDYGYKDVSKWLDKLAELREERWVCTGGVAVAVDVVARVGFCSFSRSVRTMPNTKSAKKRQKQNLVRRARNKAVTSAVKTQLKKARAAVKAGDLTAGAAESKLAQKRSTKPRPRVWFIAMPPLGPSRVCRPL